MGSYRQQPGSGKGSQRKDGKRVAGKQVFPPPGSGGSDPEMRPRDLDFIPETVGGREQKPAGDHIHDRDRTGTAVGKPMALVDSNAKVLRNRPRPRPSVFGMIAGRLRRLGRCGVGDKVALQCSYCQPPCTQRPV